MNYTRESKITDEEIEWLEKKYAAFFHKSSIFYKFPLILQHRLLGKSLQDIAYIYNVTKERIRQVEAKAVEIIKYGKRTSSNH